MALALQPGLTLSGRIAFEGAAAMPADLTRVRVSIAPADRAGAARSLLSSSAGRVDASGRFTIANIVPGAYRLSGGGGGQSWSIKSAIVEGQDTLDFPVEMKQDVAGAVVTFTDRQAEISGTVSDERGRPSTTATVVLYPADEQFRTGTSRRIRAARPATDGTFTFTNVAPGEYRLAPATDPEPGAWYDPGFLDQLDGGSIRITVGEGEKKSQAVRVSSGGI